MAHTNERNPINDDLAVSVSTVQEINRQHRHIRQYIADGSEGSLALEQVRAAQYAQALSEARHAVNKLLGLIERNMEHALVARPSAELEALKDQLGL
jgi:hypothetical protein